IGFLDEVVLAGFMVANLTDPDPYSLPRNGLQGLRPVDLLDEGIQSLCHLRMLSEQSLNQSIEPRLLLQNGSHLPAFFLKAEVIGEMRPHLSEAGAQLCRAFP